MSQDNQSITLPTLFPQKGLDRGLALLKNKPVFIFIGLLSLTLFFYLPTLEAGFVTDVTSGIERIQGQPFRNIIYSFGFPALNQLSILGFYLLYTLFGLNGWPWYLVFCGLHALNAFLSFIIYSQFFQYFSVKQARSISLMGALCFLLSPYQTEVLVWRACLNYLLVTAFILGSLWCLIHYLKAEKRRYILGVHGFFLGALFTFELALVLPLLTILFYASWIWWSQQERFAKVSKFSKSTNTSFFKEARFIKSARFSKSVTLRQFTHYFTKISLPQLGLISGYFLLNKWMIGSWVGHYGAATHLKFSLTKMSSTLLKYVLKYLFFVRAYPHKYKGQIFDFCDKYGLLIVGLVGIISLLRVFYQKQINREIAVIYTLLLAAFILTLLPVLNLYFYSIQHIENDRYGYLASLFGLMLLSFFLFQLPKFFRYLLLIIYLSTSIFLLIQTNQIWKESTAVFYSLLADYRWYEAENVVILNVPDNYQGAYLFRIIGRKSGFQDALTYIQQKEVKGKIWEVVQYNMTRPIDGVTAIKNTPNQLKIKFNQWGNWFWRNGIGAGPTHQRSIYTAHFKGQYYLLDLKNPPANTVYIYQDGKEWKELLRNDER